MASDLEFIQLKLDIVGAVIWLFIYIPLIIYHGIRYYKVKDHPVYKARYSNITIYEIVLITIKLANFSIDSTIINYLPSSQFIRYALDILNNYFAYYLLYSFVWRYWAISYDINWSLAVISNEWKKIINNQTATNWYIKYKNSIGNYKWVQKILFAMATFSSSFGIGIIAYSKLNYPNNKAKQASIEIWASWMYSLPLFILIIIYIKTPKFQDTFYISQEMRYIFVLLIIDYSAYYFYLIIDSFVANKTVILVVDYVANHFIIGSQMGAVMISTAWVQHKVSSIIKANRFRTKRGDNKDYIELLNIAPSESIDCSNTQVTLMQILSHPRSFQIFITHLSFEFCLESLLSMIEFVQFQKKMAETVQNADKNDKMLWCNMVKLPDIVPASEIVRNKEYNDKKIAYELYAKYVKNGAMLEINIPYRIRKNLIQLLDNCDVWMGNENISDKQMLHLFDSCCQEMKQLMMDSFTRFILKPSSQRLINELIFV